MKLPKIEQPIFETKLPILDRKVRYHLMTVKEEKALMVAKESDDVEHGVLALEQVLSNCVVDEDVTNLPLTDFTYLFTQIRAKSINNVIEFVINDPETGEEIEVEIDLDDMIVNRDENHSHNVKVTDDVMLVMRYPTVREFPLLIESIENEEARIELLLSCIDKIATEDQIYELADFSKEDIEEFFDQLTERNVRDIGQFFETIPTVSFETEYQISTGETKKFVIEGIENFI